MLVRKIPMIRIREQYKKLRIDRKWIVLGLILALLSFFVKIWPIIFLSAFCVVNAILLSIDRYINAPLDLEFSTFSAVLMTKAFGLNWGILVAVMTKIAAILYNKNVRVDHFFMIGGYVIAALIANILPGSVVVIGVLATIVVNIYTVFISRYVTGLSNYEIMTYGASNTIFNIVLFIGFSEFFYAVMIILR
ncbi:MAG: hypothetical protein ABIJ34_00485 [archaeon]